MFTTRHRKRLRRWLFTRIYLNELLNEVLPESPRGGPSGRWEPASTLPPTWPIGPAPDCEEIREARGYCDMG